MTQILAIDPGTHNSGLVVFEAGRVLRAGIHNNEFILHTIRESRADVLAIEMIASYGMPVGREVFETCVWIGRMVETWREPYDVRMVYRKDVKLHLCGTAKAKDPNIRQALLDKVGPAGTKKAPGPTYGVRSHAWAALAVAVTVADGLLAHRAVQTEAAA